MTYDPKQLIVQPTRETIETSSTLDIILVSYPDLHKKNGVMKSLSRLYRTSVES